MATHIEQSSFCSVAQRHDINTLRNGEQNMTHVNAFSRTVRGLICRMVTSASLV